LAFDGDFARPSQRLAEETIELNRRVIEETQDFVDPEDSGVDNFGLDGALRRLAFIFENIPFAEPVENQVAYVLRSVMCAQIFNNGNKRTAVVLGLSLAAYAGHRLASPDEELYEFVLRRFGECPRWPVRDEDILARDSMYQSIASWIGSRLERI
jgi:prophage maintenance system killer protein